MSKTRIVNQDIDQTLALAGELGGTLASPTVDATHAGTTHSAATDTHIADAVDAHDASAISFTPNGSIAATDVQAAIVEVRDEAGASAHAASHEDGGADEIDVTGLVGAGGGGDLVYSAPGADTAINSLTNVGIISQGIAVAAGDQIIMDAWFTILNNSGATRVITLEMEYDALFSIDIATAALANSSTLMHPMHMTSILDIRSSSLAYVISKLDMQLAAGIASGGDVTVAATMLQNMSWGTSASDATGTVTVELKAKSANATATQTLRLHHATIRRVTP